MESSHYTEAKALFSEVCDLPKAAQRGRLQALTDDAALIAYVEKLLRQDDTHHPRIAQSVLRTLSHIEFEAVKVGETLGAWKLVEEIGQGGMGTVFLAQRVDGHFNQTAAVKLLHGIPNAKSLEYLTRERQILASLTHANIARLYDGGETAQRQPYLVMEYVEGVAIDSFVRAKKLTIHQVLALLQSVCAAVSFAHQRLIIHCDIKPSNILVTDCGVPMLLDFGIARLLEAGADTSAPSARLSGEIRLSRDAAGHNTQNKARAFTPRWASPEQQRAGVLTTATDVFSLGKLLEYLINNSLEMPVIRTSSTIISDKSLDKNDNIPSELRAVIAKAVEVDPLKRYTTVNALSADIARYTRHEPVKAVLNTPIYIAQKFMQRHWPWLIAASFFTLSLGFAATRIVAERNRAQGAELVALQERDSTKLAEAAGLLERDAARAARGHAEQARDRAASAEAVAAQQRDRAQAAEVLALRERDYAKLQEGTAVLERNRATAAQTDTLQTNAFLLSVFKSGEPGANAGNVPVSVLLDKAEARLDLEMKGQPAVQAQLYSTLGSIQRGMAEFVKAERLHNRAIEVQRKVAAEPAKPEARSPRAEKREQLALAAQLFSQANDLFVNGKAPQAMKAAREALVLREKFAVPDSLELGESISQVGQIMISEGKLVESTPLLERGLAIIKAAAPEGEEMAFALANFAWQQHRLGDAARAEALARAALALRVKQGGSIDAPYAIKQREDLAQILGGAGKFAEAEALHRQTIAARTALHGRENMRVANGLQRLALFLVARDRAVEALPYYLESREIMVKTVSTELPHYRNVNLNLGLAYLHLNDAAAASAPLQLAVDYTRKFVEVEGDAKLIEYLNLLGGTLTKLGQFDEARARLEESIGRAKSANVNQQLKIATVLIERINLETNAGNFVEATKFLAQLTALPQGVTLAPKQLALLAASRARLGAVLN